MQPTRSILLAEEDAATRAFLADNLTADGYRVLVADDKPAALELLERPAAGPRPLRRQRRHARSCSTPSAGRTGSPASIAPDTPLIVLTADADELARVRYLDRGGDDVITKPFSLPRAARPHPRAAAPRLRAPRREPHPRSARSTIDRVSRQVHVGRHGRRAVEDGVRAAHPPRRRPDARVHQGRAAARRVGLSLDGPHPHARLARLPAAQQARRRRRTVRRERVGRRLPARRRRPATRPSGARHETRAAAAQSAAAPRRRAGAAHTATAHDAAAARAVAQARPPTGGPDGAPAVRAPPRRSGAKIVGGACVVCLQTKGITPAHLAPRSLGGCDDPDCVVPLCWMHHRAYDTGRLELLPHLEPRWRAEIAHAVLAPRADRSGAIDWRRKADELVARRAADER